MAYEYAAKFPDGLIAFTSIVLFLITLNVHLYPFHTLSKVGNIMRAQKCHFHPLHVLLLFVACTVGAGVHQARLWTVERDTAPLRPSVKLARSKRNRLKINAPWSEALWCRMCEESKGAALSTTCSFAQIVMMSHHVWKGPLLTLACALWVFKLSAASVI